ncbi:MAG: 4-hydroxy-tetrahydrodipicolinate reductase [Clostridiales bacterium]|nr:4-hydroxy-tetrahydrodipicolinate reductase [Clostridiales bacterium]
MKRLLISGAQGRMGRMIASQAAQYDLRVIGGIDRSETIGGDVPLFSDFSQVNIPADVLIDFSSPFILNSLLAFATKNGLPCVLGTTGYTEANMDALRNAAERIPLFYSPNMSLGIYVLKQLAAQAARMLDGFDIEIVEKHHNQKADSPSGTALALLDAVKKADSLPVFGREGRLTKRAPGEIGVHAVRGGTVAGEHEVGYYGNHEVITLSHHAQDRGVFAAGALKAAGWLMAQPAGLYGMQDLMENQ